MANPYLVRVLVWPPHTYFQIAAIQHGVRMILAQTQPAAEVAHG